MLKKIVCTVVVTLAMFAIINPQVPFADENHQRWFYVTVIKVCKNDNSIVISQYTDRTLEKWYGYNPEHPPDTLLWEQVCYPLYGGGVHCEMQWVPRHTSHPVYWNNARYQTVLQEVERYACR